MEAIKIVGHIDISMDKKKNIVPDDYCYDCGHKVDSSFEYDNRRITIINSDGTISERFICSYCLDDLFEDYSIFD